MIAKLTQYTALKDFGDDAEEGNWTIVVNVSFVSFFINWYYVGQLPLIR